MAKKSMQTSWVALVSALTGHRRVVRKKKGTDKLQKKAFDPIARKHTLYEEKKVNLGRNVVKARKN